MRRGSYSWETQDMHVRRIWYTQSTWGKNRLRKIRTIFIGVGAMIGIVAGVVSAITGWP